MNGIKFTVVLLVLIFVAAFPSTAQETAEQIPESGGETIADPVITIVPDQDIININVQPGPEVLVHVMGTVYCELPPDAPANLTCVFEMWPDACGRHHTKPQPFVFDINHTEVRFNVTVMIPSTWSHSQEIQVSLTGRWSYNESVKDFLYYHEYVYLIANPYSGIEVYCKEYYKTGKMGEKTQFDVRISNAANTDDNISVELISAPDEIDIDLSSNLVNIEEAGAYHLLVNVTHPYGIGKRHIIEIKVSSDLPGEYNESYYTLVYRSNGYGNSFTSDPLFIISALLIIIAVISAVIVILVRKKKKRSSAGS